MRLRDLSILIAALSLSVVAGASLATAMREPQTTTVLLTVRWPELPEPAEPAPALAPEPEFVPPAEEFRLIPLDQKDQSGRSTFVVQRRVEHPFIPTQYRWTLAFYSFDMTAKEESRLQYLGTRCVEYDMGADELILESKRHWSPDDIRKAYEEARQKQKDD